MKDRIIPITAKDQAKCGMHLRQVLHHCLLAHNGTAPGLRGPQWEAEQWQLLELTASIHPDPTPGALVLRLLDNDMRDILTVMQAGLALALRVFEQQSVWFAHPGRTEAKALLRDILGQVESQQRQSAPYPVTAQLQAT